MADINNIPLNKLKIKTSHNSYSKQIGSITPNPGFTEKLLKEYYFRALELDLAWDENNKIPLVTHVRKKVKFSPDGTRSAPLEDFLKVIIDFKDKQLDGFKDPIFVAFERFGAEIDDEMWVSIFSIIEKLIKKSIPMADDNFKLSDHLILPESVNQSRWKTLGRYRKSEYSKLILTTHDELIDRNSPFRKYLHIDNRGKFQNHAFRSIGKHRKIKPSQISEEVDEGVIVRIFPPGPNSVFTGSVRAFGLFQGSINWLKEKFTIKMNVEEVLGYPAQMIAMDDWDNKLLDENFQVQNDKGKPVRSGFIRNYLSIDNSEK